MKILTPQQDPLNKKGTRNAVNTDLSDYNCMAYALGSLYCWARPYSYSPDEREDEIIEMMQYMTVKECANYLLKKDKENILNTLKGRIREISYDEIVEDDEIVVAFREYVKYFDDAEFNEFPFVDFDFHFIVRLGDDWYEKCGAGEPNKVDYDNVWMNSEGFEYNSDTVYFAIKEEF